MTTDQICNNRNNQSHNRENQTFPQNAFEFERTSNAFSRTRSPTRNGQRSNRQSKICSNYDNDSLNNKLSIPQQDNFQVRDDYSENSDMNIKFLLKNSNSLNKNTPKDDLPSIYEFQLFFIDIIFMQYRPFVIIQILRQSLVVTHLIYMGQNWFDLVLSTIIQTLFVVLQVKFDIELQKVNDEVKAKDLKVMKTLHDLKNPVLALITIINDKKLDKSAIQSMANADLEDINEMLENLRAEFKSRYKMESKEDLRDVDTIDLLENLSRSHIRLAKNGNNNLIIEAESLIPQQISIPKLSVMRVCNNIITNSLKHTINGEVLIQLRVPTTSILNEQNYIHKGSNYNPNKRYILFEFSDNGSGIPKSKINKIFNVMESDLSKANQDGTGLGLDICKQICENTNSFIKYISEENKFTIFRFFVPIGNIETNKSAINAESNSELISRRFSKTINKSIKVSETNHKCHEVILAEDNPTILKKYENQLNKNSIQYNAFLNGKDCQDYISSIKCDQCSKLLVITDLSMPHLDGIQLAKKLKSYNSKESYIVLVSAEEYENEENLFNEVYLKPLPLKNLKSIYGQYRTLQE